MTFYPSLTILVVHDDDRVELWGEPVGIIPGMWRRFTAITNVEAETLGSWCASEDSGWYGLWWGPRGQQRGLWLHLRHKTTICRGGVERRATAEDVVVALKAWVAAPKWDVGRR